MIKTIYRAMAVVILMSPVAGCGDWASLTIPPQTVLTDEQVWGSPQMIRGVLADYYSRIPMHVDFTRRRGGDVFDFAAYDEAIWSGQDSGVNSLLTYPYSRWNIWDEDVWIAPNQGGDQGVYGLIRDINVAIAGIEVAESAPLTPVLKTEFLAELRFLRAFVYFELVKRTGGVPIVTSELIYDFSGDPSALQQPRDTEAAVYDFIGSELDAIMNQLGNSGSQSRANRAAALALKSRAMLYAGSIARHNSEMAQPITLAGGEVGIPASRAAEYYQKSLDASRELISGGTGHQLYRGNPHPGENFYEAVSKKQGNNEVILAKDYSVAAGRTHQFTREIIPHTMTVDVVATIGGGVLSPTLQLVESFDRLDGSPGTMHEAGTGSNTAAGQANWVFFDEREDIFANRDGRLYGTVLYPGASFQGETPAMQAGVYVWDEAAGRYDIRTGQPGDVFSDGGVLTGHDGPVESEPYRSSTGFFLRKYLDPAPGARSSAVDSEMWWVWFRLGEVYMNAAEAAFELGQTGEALGYVNTLRERAGFPPNSLTSLTREKIRSERWAELAFEDHRVWDLKRWRIAHLVWDGQPSSSTANARALWPYRIVHPGHPNDGKFVYDEIISRRQTVPRFFRVGNYYSEIPDDVISANPQLVRNPFH